jgi:hypothetical protein
MEVFEIGKGAELGGNDGVLSILGLCTEINVALTTQRSYFKFCIVTDNLYPISYYLSCICF